MRDYKVGSGEALDACGLACIAVRGIQADDGDIDEGVDDEELICRGGGVKGE